MNQKIKKIIVILTFLFFVCKPDIQAQHRVTLAAGIENSLPIDHFREYYTYGIGPVIVIDYRLLSSLNLSFSGAYIKYYINKQNLGVSGSEDFLPMILGVKGMVMKPYYILSGAGVNLDFGNVTTAYIVYNAGIGRILFDKLVAEIKYERTGSLDFTPKVIKLRLAYKF